MFIDSNINCLHRGDKKLLQSLSVNVDLVVAQDSSRDYKTGSDAVNMTANLWGRIGNGRYVIYVKAGTYEENVQITARNRNIMLVGDGINKTIITGNKSVGGGSTVFRSATVAVTGDGFIGRGLTIRNTTGAQNHQAVALRVGVDHSVFYQCSIEGYHNTLNVYLQQQFYRDCDIYGTLDFIFGNVAVVIQNSNIVLRYNLSNINTITAQSRDNTNEGTRISIHDSKVKATSDLQNASSVNPYIGRPTSKYSRTVFMKTYLDSVIDPAGWTNFNGDFAVDTLFYGDYMNTGLCSSTDNRVKWNGYRVINSAVEAFKFTVGNFIAGSSWLPGTRVPFTAGL